MNKQNFVFKNGSKVKKMYQHPISFLKVRGKTASKKKKKWKGKGCLTGTEHLITVLREE